MNELLISQLYNFIIYCFSGILIGIFFDFFRILRKSFKTADIITYFQDILFWFITGLFLIYIIFTIDNGEIRSYIFLGIGFGILLYILIFSKFFINISLTIINFIKSIIRILFKIFIFPIIYLLKKLKSFINKVINNIFTKISNFNKKIFINVKKCKKERKIKNMSNKRRNF